MHPKALCRLEMCTFERSRVGLCEVLVSYKWFIVQAALSRRLNGLETES